MGAMFIQTPNGAERVGGGGGGGSGVDVTASVGQTIVVKEVDANGKPTKWEAADYQPRTHWSEETVVMPEQEAMAREEGAFIFDKSGELTFQAGKRYQVTLNGVVYESVAKDFGGGVVIFGNAEFASPIGGPYYGVYMHDADSGEDNAALIVLDQGEDAMFASIAEVTHTPIPVQYVTNAFPYCIELTAEYHDDGNIKSVTCAESGQMILDLYRSGRSITLKRLCYQSDSDSIQTWYYHLIGETLIPSTGAISLGFTFNQVVGSNSYFPTIYLVIAPDGTVGIDTLHHS